MKSPIAAGAQFDRSARYSMDGFVGHERERVKILQEIIRVEGNTLLAGMFPAEVQGSLENFKKRGNEQLETDTVFMQ